MTQQLTQQPTDALVRTGEGLVSARCFSDPRVYDMERERLFTRSWLFVAHESEIPQPGDFVTRTMGEDPVLVTRGPDGVVRVLLNVCRHRARMLCSVDGGNASHFMCPYHGWTYSNTGELTGVPYFESYQGRLVKGEWGLQEAPHVDSYRGLIFACWDAAAPSLGDYLGSMKWTMDLIFGRADAFEVTGPPQRWVVDCNWKLGSGNFGGNLHHVPVTHGFTTALGLKATRSRRQSYYVTTRFGHIVSVGCHLDMPHPKPYLGLPRDLMPEYQRNLSPEQFSFMERIQTMAGTVFPNLSYLNTSSHRPSEWGAPPEKEVSFVTLRQWQPLGHDKMEMWSWGLVEKNASEEWKRDSKTCYQRTFGAAGVFEQDDPENWSEITRGLRGAMANRLWLHYGMGQTPSPAPDWPGPPPAYNTDRAMSEINERVFYQRWHEMLYGQPT
ncbi:MAG: aromatic ring-hydroxylating dioxygenase subunit alpha [Dehalococcoidia bacterium]|nr:aromatic ring-hydroxylating dioxygenase subunit alpha [Dehalococcoidia bacterium]